MTHIFHRDAMPVNNSSRARGGGLCRARRGCILRKDLMLTDANVMPGIVTRPADPRALLLSVLLVVVAAMATVRTVTAMLILFVFVVLWHAALTGRAAHTLRDLRRLAPFALLIIVLNAVLVPGDPILTIAGRRIVSSPGLRDGVFFALRLGSMLMAMSLLVAGSTAEGMARGVYDFVRPFSARLAERIAFFVCISLGFVPLFMDEIERVRVAQSFRGGTLEGGLTRRAGSVRMWLIPVLMSAVRRSGQIALAVELREIRSRLVPSMPAARVGAGDVAWLAAVIAVTLAASLLR
jgi:energy-coupling factor transport system permease protein